MSYILDALKKLEQEKNKMSRTGGKVNISGELFAHERPKTAEGRRFTTVILVSIAVLATFLVTWVLLNRTGKRSQSVNMVRINQPIPVANNYNSVVVPMPSPPPVIATPTVVPSATAVPPHLPSVAPPVAAATENTDDDDERPRGHRNKPALKSVVVKPREVALPATVPAPADIKVSGIAWQDERSSRRAVVNGFLMREGTVVSGAKITEILQDRVKFSLSGTTFEVTLVSTAGTAAAGK